MTLLVFPKSIALHKDSNCDTIWFDFFKSSLCAANFPNNPTAYVEKKLPHHSSWLRLIKNFMQIIRIKT